MSVAQPPRYLSEDDAKASITQSVTTIAAGYQPRATAVMNSDIVQGSVTPHDLAITYQQTPAGYGWEVTIHRQEWDTSRQLCELTCGAGSAEVVATWEPDAGPYLTALALDLEMGLLSQGKAAA